MDCGREFEPERFDLRCPECDDEAWHEYAKAVSAAYWAEMAEFEAGIHPTQLHPEIIEEFDKIGRD